MRGVFSVGLGRLRRTVFVAAAVLLGSISGADAASITATWTAPTRNADGSPLRDLAAYRLYLGTSTPTCPGGPAHTVPAPSAAPTSGQTVSRRVAGLTASTTYVARVTAIDSSGNESACSPAVSGVARADVSVSPTTAVNFGSVAAGATADRTFTVQNTGVATVTGTAAVGAPFTLASGGSFSLAPGASQSVVVRFRPTTAGTFAGNATFTVDGEVQSRTLSGTATGSSTGSGTPVPPSSAGGALRVFITSPKSGATVGGSGTAALWVEGTSGSSNTFTLSVDGTAMGTRTTSSRGPVTIPWTAVANGTRTFSAVVRDAAGRTGSTSVTVRVSGSTAAAPAPAPPQTPAPPASSPGTGTLRAVITSPTGGATVGGSGTAVLWVEGTSGSSNTFTLSVDGTAMGTRTTSSRGPVTIPWTAVANGTRTFSATVRDATGRTGSTSVTVRVSGSTAAAPAPAPPASSSNDTLRVVITQPTSGATVNGTAWVVLWAEGTSGSSNTFTLSVDGVTVASQSTSARGPVAIPWTSSGNGSRTLTAVVRDARGNTGRASVAVSVRN